MKGYVSLLKGAKFNKKNKFKSLFLIHKPEEEKENEDLENENILPNITSNKSIKNIINEPKKVIKLFKRKSRMTRVFEDYEDLFFYLLKEPNKIEIFEVNAFKNKIKKKNEKKSIKDTYESESEDDFNKESNNIDINKIFYKNIYLGLAQGEKHYWENFYFPKAIYRIIYQKSRNKQKEILNFCIKYGINYDKVISSYEKIYANKIQKKNWQLDPLTAYNNFMEIYHKDENLIQNKDLDKNLNEKKDNLFHFENYDKFDNDNVIVVKTNNKGKGKTLIFDGKLLNVYVDDYLRKNNDHMISINSPTQKKKEIVYSAKELLPEIKPSFSFEKNHLLKRNKFNETNKHNYDKKNSKNNLMGKEKEKENEIRYNSMLNKHKQKNKRNKKHYKEINKTNEQLNENKETFPHESTHPIKTCDINMPLNIKVKSSDLILKKIRKKYLAENDKKYNNNFFNMLKFSYYN